MYISMIDCNGIIRILLFINIFGILFAPVFATDDTQYIHGFVGFGVGLASAYITDQLFTYQDFGYYAIPLITVIGIAAGKEFLDPKFDTDDFNATLLGGLLGIITVRFYF